MKYTLQFSIPFFSLLIKIEDSCRRDKNAYSNKLSQGNIKASNFWTGIYFSVSTN